jgi:2-oxoglutarate ferredoxin oxidoreductase subunit gamma
MLGTKQIRICGFGGQGIILGGKILGSASISAGKYVAGLSTYGGAARGGVCEADIVMSDEEIVFPQVMEADILVAMSQSAYDKNIKMVSSKAGLVIYDSQYVIPKQISGLKQIGIPATEVAVKELNNKQVANIVLLGAALEITKVISQDALIEAIRKGVRERFIELNIKAVNLGVKLGREAVSKVEPKAK